MEAYDLFDRTLTVSEANGIIHDTVEEMFYDLSIEGEISGFRPASSGHWYFTLKDSQAALDAAVFRSAQYSMVMPENGDLVIAKGSLSYYTKAGKLTFVIREMKRKGDGNLLEILEKRKAYYRSMGYFDEDIKKPIPEEIERIGVVTSPTGAALRDILNITKRRAPSIDIILFPTSVQGEGSAENIALRIRQANNFDACSVLIVGRGGGSTEDLSCFSDPLVIEAIHESSIPIISAVGHEIDWPISDFVADKRAPTPSAAAEIVTETIYRRRERLEKSMLLAISSMKEKIADNKERVESCKHSLTILEKRILRYAGTIPSTEDLRKLLILRMQNAETRLGYAEDAIIENMEKRINNVSSAISRLLAECTGSIISKCRESERMIAKIREDNRACMMNKSKERKLQLESLRNELDALSPLSILNRGYSVTTDSEGRIIKSKRDVRPGFEINTRLSDGMIKSIVKEG